MGVKFCLLLVYVVGLCRFCLLLLLCFVVFYSFAMGTVSSGKKS